MQYYIEQLGARRQYENFEDLKEVLNTLRQNVILTNTEASITVGIVPNNFQAKQRNSGLNSNINDDDNLFD